jgi:hypothetical protein
MFIYNTKPMEKPSCGTMIEETPSSTINIRLEMLDECT